MQEEPQSTRLETLGKHTGTVLAIVLLLILGNLTPDLIRLALP